MTLKSKQIITSIVAGICVFAAYLIYQNIADFNSLEIGSLALTMLVFIGIGIGVQIVVTILFQIFVAIVSSVKSEITGSDMTEVMTELETEEDEMDKTINLKSMRIGYVICGLGFLAMLICLSLGVGFTISLNIAFCSFFIGSLLEGLVSVYHYERGV